MTRSVLALAFVLAIALSAAARPAEAGRGDQRTRSVPKIESRGTAAGTGAAGFRLESRVLAAEPEIAAALDLARARPNDSVAWRSLGTALAERGAFDDAVAAFERALDVDPEDPDAWVDLGAAQVRAGDTSRGVRSLRRSLRIEPFHARARYNLGVAYESLDLYDEALDQYELALTIDPALGDAKLNPSAANNPLLPIVKLRVYMRTTGAASTLFTLPEPE